MSRTLTNRNHSHPHYQLKNFQQQVYAAYRRMSREQLALVSNNEGIDPQLPRAQCLELIVAKATTVWKQKWKDETGWDFDDIYNQAKFEAHIKEDMRKAKEAEGQGIDHRPMDRDGNYITKEQFDAMPKEMQDEIRTNLMDRTRKIVASGFAGVMANGNIVDRRLHPQATPIPQNKTLNVPKAEKVA